MIYVYCEKDAWLMLLQRDGFQSKRKVISIFKNTDCNLKMFIVISVIYYIFSMIFSGCWSNFSNVKVKKFLWWVCKDRVSDCVALLLSLLKLRDFFNSFHGIGDFIIQTATKVRCAHQLQWNRRHRQEICFSSRFCPLC